ncbi:unnamed protein product [marine sediment metagenome]|uniref:Cytidyltransferase-like domain-containing protein n=1 Tax=marine sediment metagenome TaxID=412755 RepID=X1J0F3_9ZZZZ
MIVSIIISNSENIPIIEYPIHCKSKIMSYIVYVGSFDPFHLGHLEAAMMGLEYI